MFLFLNFMVSFGNGNWQEFFTIQIVGRCKKKDPLEVSCGKSESGFFHLKLLAIDSWQIEVVSSPVRSQYSTIK